MKTVGLAAALSIALNIFVLWQLQDLSRQSAGVTADFSEKENTAVVATSSTGLILPLERAAEEGELDELRSRLSDLEASFEALEQRQQNQAAVSHRELSAQVQRISKGITQTGSNSNDDWFWNSPDTGEPGKLQSMPDGESYAVQSLVCRADWCRADILLDDTAGDGPEAELELQLQLSESLGRDIELSFGERSGNNQVIFIRNP